VQEALLLICQQLHAKGLNPSVALLRSRSATSLSIPQAVKAVQEWNQSYKTMDGQALTHLTGKQDANSQGRLEVTDVITNIESKLVVLEQEIATIRRALAQIT
jgi:hypothetical protein